MKERTATHRNARFAAAVVAISAIIGIHAFMVEAWADGNRNPLAILWNSAFFLTDLSNLAVAYAFTRVALGHASPSLARWTGFAVTLMLVILVGYFGVQGGATGFGTRGVADTLTHGVTPLLAVLCWLILPHGTLRWRDALPWSAAMLGYFAYALLRGRLTGKTAYPFIDTSEVGATAVATYVAAFVVAALLLGLLLAAIDRWLGGRRSSEGRAI